jgi:hypothetical protein
VENGDGSVADGADCGRNDDVGGAGNLPGKRDRSAGRDEVALAVNCVTWARCCGTLALV